MYVWCMYMGKYNTSVIYRMERSVHRIDQNARIYMYVCISHEHVMY